MISDVPTRYTHTEIGDVPILGRPKVKYGPQSGIVAASNCTRNLLENAGSEAVSPAGKYWIATFSGYSGVILRRLGLIESSQPTMR